MSIDVRRELRTWRSSRARRVAYVPAFGVGDGLVVGDGPGLGVGTEVCVGVARVVGVGLTSVSIGALEHAATTTARANTSV
jgi:hypothetical protein